MKLDKDGKAAVGILRRGHGHESSVYRFVSTHDDNNLNVKLFRLSKTGDVD
jgi:hypothetical protein